MFSASQMCYRKSAPRRWYGRGMTHEKETPMDENTLRRFMAKVEKQDAVTSPHVDTPCWLWTAAKVGIGYGLMRAGEKHDTTLAHRLAFAHWVGPVRALVLHRCDTPSCVNPAHLFSGTQAENITDMVAKDRHSRGARSPNAKLTPAIVAQIRCRRGAGETQRAIAQSIGISNSHVSRVLAGKAWKHV